MAKSSETFNKKEKEKKRLKKAQEKKQKTEQRRNESSSGKSLEDMMAYVDENGNITSTPPISRPQRQVSLEDIHISTPKQVDEPEDALKTGTINFFNTEKGFGFIRDGKSGESVFFHVNSLTYQAKENDKVSYTTEKGPRGLSALNVTKA